MSLYQITVFDRAVLEKPKRLKTFELEAESRADALDKAHTVASKRYPAKKLFVEIREMGAGC